VDGALKHRNSVAARRARARKWGPPPFPFELDFECPDCGGEMLRCLGELPPAPEEEGLVAFCPDCGEHWRSVVAPGEV
jgi:predicted RNA-binding Zn-ribbon protein involved in translation (DUF1610 family)